MEDNEKSAIADLDEKTVYDGIRDVLDQARRRAVAAVNSEMVLAYWEIGRRIHEAVGDRGEYGKRLVEYLSKRLTAEFGRGFSERNLQQMRRFFESFRIPQTLSAELSWSHYCVLIRIGDSAKRDYYAAQCASERWSVRRLEREVHLLRYERLVASGGGPSSQIVGNSGKPTDVASASSLDIRDPYVLDFLGLPDSAPLHESDLEQAIIDHLQDFMVELGAGFSFVGRQVRVSSELSEYYVDLVFYHVRLKCYVLVDLKAGKLDPRDVGQMDFYVRLFDDAVAAPDDNPTVGVVLCAEGDRAVAKYSALADDRGLFASSYVTVLPSEEEIGRAAGRLITGA